MKLELIKNFIRNFQEVATKYPSMDLTYTEVMMFTVKDSNTIVLDTYDVGEIRGVAENAYQVPYQFHEDMEKLFNSGLGNSWNSYKDYQKEFQVVIGTPGYLAYGVPDMYDDISYISKEEYPDDPFTAFYDNYFFITEAYQYRLNKINLEVVEDLEEKVGKTYYINLMVTKDNVTLTTEYKEDLNIFVEVEVLNNLYNEITGEQLKYKAPSNLYLDAVEKTLEYIKILLQYEQGHLLNDKNNLSSDVWLRYDVYRNGESGLIFDLVQFTMERLEFNQDNYITTFFKSQNLGTTGYQSFMRKESEIFTECLGEINRHTEGILSKFLKHYFESAISDKDWSGNVQYGSGLFIDFNLSQLKTFGTAYLVFTEVSYNQLVVTQFGEILMVIGFEKEKPNEELLRKGLIKLSKDLE